MEKNKKMMIVIIALLVVLLVVIAGLSVFAFRLLNADKAPAEDPAFSSSDVPIENSDKVGLTSPLNINLKPGIDAKEHAISVEIEVYIDAANKKDADMIAIIKDSEAIIRDAAITVLRNKTIEDVRDDDALELIKLEILQRLQEEFKTNIIYRIYMKNYYFSV